MMLHYLRFESREEELGIFAFSDKFGDQRNVVFIFRVVFAFPRLKQVVTGR